MDTLVIKGGRRLKGTVEISGAKNSALPVMAATLLTDEPCTIKNIPAVSDIRTMIKILAALGKDVRIRGKDMNIVTVDTAPIKAPYELVSTMRGSICVLGPLLGKRRKASVSFPGGCVIGPRPIDLHLKGLKALGARLAVRGGYIVADGRRMAAAHIYLGGHFGSSVLATANMLMAAVLTKGKTVIENAACEPEVEDLIHFLMKMGARIHGLNSHRIEVEGVKALKGAAHALIADRIEAGTYMMAAAMTKGELFLKGAKYEHLLSAIDVLRAAGLNIVGRDDGISVRYTRPLKPMDVTTLPYPGFPTDLQAQMMALMTTVKGISVITEKIYPERFIHISELNRMGAGIMLEGPSAIITGGAALSGAPVMASDLRASAALVLAGLVASGTTMVSRVYHIDRGYEALEDKLGRVGAIIERKKS